MIPTRFRAVPAPWVGICILLLYTLSFNALAEKDLLEVTSDPGGAKIYLDGKRKGSTPKQAGKALVLELEEGEYRLEAVSEGRRPGKASQEVFVAGGAIQPVHPVPFAAPEMVRIPAGRFLMGCQPGEAECNDDEKPAHRGSVPAFELGKTEVTFADLGACMADGGCKHEPEDEGWGREDRPAINVSWDDAQEYIRWLSRKTGNAYRLPTEAEWEYAARAGTSTAFSTGRCITTRQANYDGNSDYNDCGAKTSVYLEKDPARGQLPGQFLGALRHARQRLGVDPGLLERQLPGRTHEGQCLDEWRLRTARGAGRLLGRRSKVSALRRPLQKRHRLPDQRPRFPSGQDA